MQRKIIKIDEAKCNGCGNCITGCAEGALALVDGKAKLVKDNYCDGFGDCIGTCPTGALTFEEREAEAFDPEAVKVHVEALRGDEGVKRFEEAHRRHSDRAGASGTSGCPGSLSRLLDRFSGKAVEGGGCPGSAPRQPQPVGSSEQTVSGGDMPRVIKPEIDQWPLQLHLVPPSAPYFKDRELVLMSTCGPLSAPDINWRFVRGRGIAVACPKLDRTEGYAEKIADIIHEGNVPKVIVVRMEVPCCGGLTQLALTGVRLSGSDGVVVEEATVGIDGTLKSVKQVS